MPPKLINYCNKYWINEEYEKNPNTYKNIFIDLAIKRLHNSHNEMLKAVNKYLLCAYSLLG